MFEHFDLRVLLVEHINALDGFTVVDVGAEIPPALISGDVGVSVEYGASEYSWSLPAQKQAPVTAGCVLMIRADTIVPGTGMPDGPAAVESARLLAVSIQNKESWREPRGFKHILINSTETGYVARSGAENADLFHVIRVEARKLTGV